MVPLASIVLLEETKDNSESYIRRGGLSHFLAFVSLICRIFLQTRSFNISLYITMSDMQKLTTSLKGMEIAIPPGEASDYKKNARFYASKPLPPLPEPRQLSQGISRKPIGSSSNRKIHGRNKSDVKFSSRSPPLALKRRSSRRSRRMSISSPPTGHHPSKKVQQLMGYQIDIFDERSNCPDINDSTDFSDSSSESSLLEAVTLESPFSQSADRASHPSETEGTSTRKSSWVTGARLSDGSQRSCTSQTSLEDRLPSRGAESRDRKNSDAKAARDYHKFATELAGRLERPSVDVRYLYPRELSPFSRPSGFSGRSSPQRRSRPQSIDSSIREISPRRHPNKTPNTNESRPFSAFESDTSDEEGEQEGRLSGQLKAFFSRRSEGDLSLKSKRGSRDEADKKGLFASAREKAKDWKAEKRREQRKKEIKVVGDERSI